MPRKRDFILFILCIVFLVLAIGSTYLYQNNTLPFADTISVDFSYDERSLEGAASPEVTEDRTATIARLKEKIAEGAGLNQGVPNLDAIPETPEAAPVPSGTRTVQRCTPAVDDTLRIASWPKTGVSVKAVEGVRLVSEARVVAKQSTSSSSTSLTTIDTPLLQLSLVQLRNPNDSCIAGEIIGVTPAGALIKNGDASLYAGFSEVMLIGYALDGLPIYGVKSDTASLDACGGESQVAGYRYYLRAEDDFMLGCYAGTPAKFLN